jgi:hypothetical protein
VGAERHPRLPGLNVTALRFVKGVQQYQSHDNLVSEVAEAHAVGTLVPREIPRVTREAVVSGQDLADIGVADSLKSGRSLRLEPQDKG